MAKIAAGILSHPSGKIGSVVGATWKGIKYLRAFVIPSNPNTAAQQLVRNKFKSVVSMAKTLLGSVLQPYWDPFLKSNSGWAEFIGRAMTDMSDLDDFASVKIAEGPLEPTPITGAVYNGGNVSFLWSTSVLGNGLGTDAAVLYVYDEENEVGFADASATRADGSHNVAVGLGRDAAKMNAYLFFAQPAVDTERVSISDYLQVTV